jgi:hypothetical protein
MYEYEISLMQVDAGEPLLSIAIYRYEGNPMLGDTETKVRRRFKRDTRALRLIDALAEQEQALNHALIIRSKHLEEVEHFRKWQYKNHILQVNGLDPDPIPYYLSRNKQDRPSILTGNFPDAWKGFEVRRALVGILAKKTWPDGLFVKAPGPDDAVLTLVPNADENISVEELKRMFASQH